MKCLNPEMMEKLQHGAFARHIPGIYNATWTGMFIGTTYTRLGHGPAGAVGVTTDYQQMVKWALSGEVSQNVRAMSNATENTSHTHHKEDANGRIKARQEDHLSLRNTLDVSINPFDNESHPDGALINIMTGQIAHPDMNANNALVLGQQAITDFKNGWPGTFNEPLSKLFVPMDVKKSMCQLVWSVSMIRNLFMHVLLVYLPVHVT